MLEIYQPPNEEMCIDCFWNWIRPETENSEGILRSKLI